MKRITKVMLTTVTVSALAILGCNKDETPAPSNPTTPVHLSSLSILFSDKGVATQTFSINSSLQQTITGAQGTILTFYPNSFVTLTGGAVNGPVTIELKEIYSKKDMLLSNISTNAELYPSGPQEPLISGGEFYVNAKQGSTQLKLAPGYTYNAFLPSATAPSASMSNFHGTTTANGILWGMSQDSSVDCIPSLAPQGYFMNCDSIRWGNADQFMSAPNYTNITVNLTGTYDATQIKAYVWYDNVNTIWSMWTAFDAFNSQYTDNHTATGVPLHIIVISVKDGVLYTSIIPTTVTANGVYTANMTATDETAFTNALTALP